jgi:Flp pilus assembly CpaF family ATPase
MLPKEIYQKTTGYFLEPIRTLLDDPAVSEILVNGPIYFEKAGKL